LGLHGTGKKKIDFLAHRIPRPCKIFQLFF
jgi:hypothetical protein